MWDSAEVRTLSSISYNQLSGLARVFITLQHEFRTDLSFFPTPCGCPFIPSWAAGQPVGKVNKHTLVVAGQLSHFSLLFRGLLATLGLGAFDFPCTHCCGLT